MISPEKKAELDEKLQEYEQQRQSQMGWLQRRFGCFGSILGFIIVGVLLIGINTIFDAASSPWAYSFFGTQPTLVGQWTGAFTTPGGSRGIVYLDLQHPTYQPSGNGDSLRWIEGSGQSCIGSGAIQSYSVYGRPNTKGSDVPLEFRPTAPFVPGYSIQSMRGAWTGEELTLSGTLGHILDSSGSTIIDPNDANQSRDVTIVFRKATLADFQSACKTLAH